MPYGNAVLRGSRLSLRLSTGEDKTHARSNAHRSFRTISSSKSISPATTRRRRLPSAW